MPADPVTAPPIRYLCPACHRSVEVAAGVAELRCPTCHLVAPLSRVGTAPGVAVPIAFDREGQRIGDYQLERRIGAGGMGTVYRAVDPSGAAVAVKLLHPDASRGELIERFRREGEALRRLVHPRVVRLIDLGEIDGAPYLVTELVEGQDLAAVLAIRRPPLAEAATIVAQVCDGVAAAHAVGIVHRDLKPANVLIEPDGSAKVVDFGLAQLADPLLASLTRTDVAMGTINYLAPEQRRNAKTVDGRADVFALGVMFYEMITGELPLGRFALPSARGLPRGCDLIVERTLAADPDHRYPSATALAAALRALIAPPRSRRVLGLAAGATAVAGLAGMIAIGASAGGSSSKAAAPTPAAAAPAPLEAAAPPVTVDASVPDAPVPDASVPDAQTEPKATRRPTKPTSTKPIPTKPAPSKRKPGKPVGKTIDK